MFKIFLVNFSELEGRLDPNFYKPFFRHVVRCVNSKKSVNLGKIVKFSNESWDQKGLFKTTFPYIEIGEIDLLTGEIKQTNQLKIEDAPSRAKMIARNGDILISTTRPNRGAISFLRRNEILIASTGFSIIRELKMVNINKYYLFYWLRQNYSLWQIEQRSSGGNYPAITQEELSNIKIPIPPKEIQDKIVAKMDESYSNKQKKEAEAQQLLDSIDHYLFGELGIDLPKKEENTLQSRIFTRQLSEVSGGRFDPKYYEINKRLQYIQSQYSYSFLGEIAVIQSGAIVNTDDYISTGIPLIRINNIFKDNILLDNVKYISEEIYLKEKEAQLRNGNIIFGLSGTIGRTCIVKNNQKMLLNQRIAKIKVKEKISNVFVQFILNSPIGKLQFQQIGTGGNQINISFSDLAKIKIPLPPLEKQTEIANHITEIRNQAKRLQQEAKAGLKQAKKEVEAIILGEQQN